MKKRLNGSQILVEVLKKQGVEYIFGYPGGACMPIFDALVDAPELKIILVRHEQGATHMADGYAKATGKTGVVLVTSGPGATNTVTGILTAHMDSVPLVVLTGQTITPNLGKDAFQEADVFGVTMPVVKHSYLVRDVKDLSRIIKEAFHLASTGRPGPVLVDLPKDVVSEEWAEDFTAEMDLPGYTVPTSGNSSSIKKISGLLAKSKRPLLYVGAGVVISSAGKQVKKLAEKLQAPVTTTLLGKGSISEIHQLSVGMLGMHGTAYANKAVIECDLIMAIGARWDDRITGKVSEFCPNATKIHIDIDPAEFGKIIQPDISVNGDAALVLDELIPLVKRLDTKEWLKKIETWKKKHPLKYPKRGGLRAQHVLDELDRLTGSNAIIATDVGQHQMWAAQFCRSTRERQWLSSGGAGTMGYGFPAAIGAQLGNPEDLVVAVVGDGGFQMTMSELATAAINKLPLKILIINNNYLGMVRQWQQLFFDNRESGVDMEGNPDFVKIGEAYGIKGFHLRRSGDVTKVLKKALAYNEGPCIIEAEVVKGDNVFPMIPAGAAVSEMLIDEPPASKKLKKPVGST
ncbi:MAG: biosynthetic-type acetolactate synthase large subunit [Deltaproteobacteria bacterium]|jgi:acetolactate synthase-1/2/3 large subunit|nr:biosynthetic-type acetolactate synthase large subunit [Deltaproteobacteria bacterium]MBT5486772.1 biosynthetic-type acetolactate synthase large subunit [Deltaproteobacteria bacterium]MBT5833229.1 biosynthetic-type acetolactate synthase large subunit [Deltaproteobacteria bacterium]MBT7809998.1 biosynthetic-type acetolactate synthase large subunit [Deltaproteobacteria bacterium]